jgi:hypothetical protein
VWEKGVLLKDVPKVPFFRGDPYQRVIVNQDFPTVRFDYSGDASEKGCLAASAGAYDGNIFAIVYVE